MYRTTMTSQAKAIRVARRLQLRLEPAGDLPEVHGLARATSRAVETPWRSFAPLPDDLRGAIAAAWPLRNAAHVDGTPLRSAAGM